jgi:hypothetical protein
LGRSRGEIKESYSITSYHMIRQPGGEMDFETS